VDGGMDGNGANYRGQRWVVDGIRLVHLNVNDKFNLFYKCMQMCEDRQQAL